MGLYLNNKNYRVNYS